jgi:hypothetical protein
MHKTLQNSNLMEKHSPSAIMTMTIGAEMGKLYRAMCNRIYTYTYAFEETRRIMIRLNIPFHGIMSAPKCRPS